MNKIQMAIGRMLQKAMGFPPWNVASPMPGPYSNFFRSMNGLDSLQRVSCVYNCCNLLGRRVATLPIDIVQSDGNISVPVQSQIASLLSQPNEYMNKVVFMETKLLSLNLRGNAYSEIVRIGNRITALWPLHPDRVAPKWQGGELVYQVTMPDGKSRQLASRDVWHIRNFSLDGICGLSPLSLYAIQKTRNAAEMYESFIRNGARPSISFSSTDKPTAESQKVLRKTAEDLYSGPENAGRILFLWGGMKAEPISLSPVDAQLMEALKMDSADIAAAYGVPLNLLNMGDKAATYASAEQFNRYFVDYTLDPLCTRVAVSATESLLNPRLNQQVKFNMEALLSGDSKGKSEVLGNYVMRGIMTPNEARAKLNMKPLSGGDDLITQSNQAPLDMLGALAATDPATEEQPNDEAADDSTMKAIAANLAEIAWKGMIQ